MRAESVIADLSAMANPEKEEVYKRFFKTGPGQYGEGDRFWGLSVPQQRKIARAHETLEGAEIRRLLDHDHHEARLTGILILVEQFQKADEWGQDEIAELYLSRRDRVNNWDLVDLSAPKITGPWFFRHRDLVRYEALARQDHLWSQRIAMMTMFEPIRRSWFDPAFQIADLLIDHPHDLIHKAVGWMIREVGNRDPGAEREFLNPRYKTMPRTMLRYAIEKFPELERKAYLRGEV